jgi:hypothetical protein
MALLRKSEALARIGDASLPAQATALAGVGIAESEYKDNPTALAGDFDLHYLVLIILKMYENAWIGELLAGNFKDAWAEEESNEPLQLCALPEKTEKPGVYLRHHEGFFFSRTYPDPRLQPFMGLAARAALELMMTKQYPANQQIDFLFLMQVIVTTFKRRFTTSDETPA